MNYYYDLLVNFDTEVWNFYEWEESDPLFFLKKVPFLRVCEEDIRKMLQYQIQFDSNWVHKYVNKTILKNSKDGLHCLLFSSTKNALVCEFDLDGQVLHKSKLCIEDENNCNEVACHLKESEVPYVLKEKNEVHTSLRQIEEEKKLFQEELKKIKEHHSVHKCTYLYYEWFGILESDLDKMLHDFEQELTQPIGNKLHEMIEILHLSDRERL